MLIFLSSLLKLIQQAQWNCGITEGTSMLVNWHLTSLMYWQDWIITRMARCHHLWQPFSSEERVVRGLVGTEWPHQRTSQDSNQTIWQCPLKGTNWEPQGLNVCWFKDQLFRKRVKKSDKADSNRLQAIPAWTNVEWRQF